jgi:predicted glycosyltransferase
LIVPSAKGRPDQLIRARRLHELGAADLLPPTDLTPDALGAWMARGPHDPSPITGVIDTGGLGRLPVLLDELQAPVEAAPRRRVGTRWAPARRTAATAELAAAAG